MYAAIAGETFQDDTLAKRWAQMHKASDLETENLEEFRAFLFRAVCWRRHESISRLPNLVSRFPR